MGKGKEKFMCAWLPAGASVCCQIEAKICDVGLRWKGFSYMWDCFVLNVNVDKEKMGWIRNRKMLSLGRFLYILPGAAKQPWYDEALKLPFKNKTKKALDYPVDWGL